ncbi:exopolysaccharide biosynthesis protein, partial [Methanobacterium aggregans]
MIVTSKKLKISDFIRGLSSDIPEEGISFEDFLGLIGEYGILITSLILVAPFLLPVSIPGSSLPFGLAIILLNIAGIFNNSPVIPKMVMEYRVSKENFSKILNGMARALRGVERFSKPRLSIVTRNPVMRYVNAAITIICAFLLMLPLPIPLTDFLPAYGILFLMLGSIEGDGYVLIAGYLLVAVTISYFTFMG